MLFHWSRHKDQKKWWSFIKCFTIIGFNYPRELDKYSTRTRPNSCSRKYFYFLLKIWNGQFPLHCSFWCYYPPTHTFGLGRVWTSCIHRDASCLISSPSKKLQVITKVITHGDQHDHLYMGDTAMCGSYQCRYNHDPLLHPIVQEPTSLWIGQSRSM